MNIAHLGGWPDGCGAGLFPSRGIQKVVFRYILIVCRSAVNLHPIINNTLPIMTDFETKIKDAIAREEIPGCILAASDRNGKTLHVILLPC